jgi:hypothetical protein
LHWTIVHRKFYRVTVAGKPPPCDPSSFGCLRIGFKPGWWATEMEVVAEPGPCGR